MNGNLATEEVVVDRCKAEDGGGGIEVDSTTRVANRVTIANSKTGDEGGGIETTGGILELRNLTLSKNKARQGGGFSAESDATHAIDADSEAINGGVDLT